jgi:hypothetical protein
MRAYDCMFTHAMRLIGWSLARASFLVLPPLSAQTLHRESGTPSTRRRRDCPPTANAHCRANAPSVFGFIPADKTCHFQSYTTACVCQEKSLKMIYQTRNTSVFILQSFDATMTYR